MDKALTALHPGDTLVITTLDRLGRSTQKMLELAEELRDRNIGLRVLNLGGGDVDTKTPMGSMVFTVIAALAQMELEIKRECITDSVTKRRTTGGDLGGRRPTFTESQIRTAFKLIQAGEPATQVAKDMGSPVRRSTEESKTRILLYSPSPPRGWTQEIPPFLSGATRGRRNIHPGAPAAVTTTHRPQQVALVTVIPLFQIPVLGIRKRRAPVIGQ